MSGRDDLDPAITFEEAIARARAALEAISSDVERARREDALAHFATYVSLLREVTQRVSHQADRAEPSRDPGYWLKLEFDDGRWTVDYRSLPAPPRVGDIIELEPASRWLVRRRQHVKPAPPRAPVREFLVCAQAA
ncbi:MAG: hypothetical protein ACXVZO_10680 [Gaiellaceae bacterium]